MDIYRSREGQDMYLSVGVTIILLFSMYGDSHHKDVLVVNDHDYEFIMYLEHYRYISLICRIHK